MPGFIALCHLLIHKSLDRIAFLKAITLRVSSLVAQGLGGGEIAHMETVIGGVDGAEVGAPHQRAVNFIFFTVHGLDDHVDGGALRLAHGFNGSGNAVFVSNHFPCFLVRVVAEQSSNLFSHSCMLDAIAMVYIHVTGNIRISPDDHLAGVPVLRVARYLTDGKGALNHFRIKRPVFLAVRYALEFNSKSRILRKFILGGRCGRRRRYLMLHLKGDIGGGSIITGAPFWGILVIVEGNRLGGFILQRMVAIRSLIIVDVVVSRHRHIDIVALAVAPRRQFRDGEAVLCQLIKFRRMLRAVSFALNLYSVFAQLINNVVFAGKIRTGNLNLNRCIAGIKLPDVIFLIPEPVDGRILLPIRQHMDALGLSISLMAGIPIIVVFKEAAGINCHGAHPRVIIFAHAEIAGICSNLAQFIVPPIGKIVVAVIATHIECVMVFHAITVQPYSAAGRQFPKAIDSTLPRLGRLICVRVDNLDRVIAGSGKPLCILVGYRVITLAERIIERNGNRCSACLFGVNINLQAVCIIPISTLPFSNDNILMSVLRAHFHNIRSTGNSLCSAIRHCIV